MVRKSVDLKYLNALDANIIVYRASGEITFANQAATESLGLPIDKLLQKTVHDFKKCILSVNQESYTGQKLPFDTVLKTGKTSDEFILHVFIKNKYATYAVSASPILDAKNEVAEVIVIFRDVTEYAKQREFQKSMIKMLGHELKQPLGLIRAYLYYFKSFFRNRNFIVAKYVEKIDTQVALLTQMFNDITDASKFSFNTLSIHPEKASIVELVKSTVADQVAINPTRTIGLEISKDEFCVMEFDPIKMRQALSNLIRNAIKYSDESSEVIVSLSKTEAEVLISVKDFGVGIPVKDLQHIFEPYYRSNKTRKIKGLGLGLALVKNIVERHHGKVKAVSEKGVGSTFTIFLPIK